MGRLGILGKQISSSEYVAGIRSGVFAKQRVPLQSSGRKGCSLRDAGQNRTGLLSPPRKNQPAQPREARRADARPGQARSVAPITTMGAGATVIPRHRNGNAGRGIRALPRSPPRRHTYWDHVAPFRTTFDIARDILRLGKLPANVAVTQVTGAKPDLVQAGTTARGTPFYIEKKL